MTISYSVSTLQLTTKAVITRCSLSTSDQIWYQLESVLHININTDPTTFYFRPLKHSKKKKKKYTKNDEMYNPELK